jgi:hypothetical protein
MKRITGIIRRRFFDEIRPLEPAADMAGAECGLQGLDDESFDKMTRAIVKRIAQEIGVGPAAAAMLTERELLRERQAALQGKIDKERAAWRAAAEAASAAGWGFDWHRLLVCLLMSALIGLCFRLVWHEARWEVFGLLAVGGALAGLSPLSLMTRLKAGFFEVVGVAGHSADCLRAGQVGLRLAQLEPRLAAMNVLATALEQWQEAGVDAVMGRFRHQYRRGVAAAKLGNG